MENSDLEERWGDGAVRVSFCRQSGSTRILYRPGTQSADEGWFLVCDEHGTCLSTDTRALGNRHLTSEDWCEDCRATELVRLTSAQAGALEQQELSDAPTLSAAICARGIQVRPDTQEGLVAELNDLSNGEDETACRHNHDGDKESCRLARGASWALTNLGVKIARLKIDHLIVD